jgi:hypothetical protein
LGKQQTVCRFNGNYLNRNNRIFLGSRKAAFFMPATTGKIPVVEGGMSRGMGWHVVAISLLQPKLYSFFKTDLCATDYLQPC